MARGRYAAGEGITGAVLAMGQAMIIQDIDAERREDIRPLALHFLNRINQAHQANQRDVHLSPAALDALEAHPWPGNIRELANVIERLVLLTDGTAVSAPEVQRFLPKLAAAALPTGAGPAPSAPAAPAAIAAELATSAWAAALGYAGTAHSADNFDPPLVREYRELRSHSPQELRQALAQHGGNQSRAAQALGLTPRQFDDRWRRLVDGHA